MAAQVCVHHRTGWVFTHPAGADNVARAVELLGMVHFFCAKRCEDIVMGLGRRRQPRLHIIVDTVMDLGQGNSIAVLFGRMKRDAIVRIGKLLDQRRHAHMPCCLLLEGLVEFRATQPLGDQRLRRAQRRAGRPAMAVIADLDAERPALVAEVADAEIFDPRGRERAAIGPDRVERCRPAQLAGMVHEVAPDLIGAIGDAIGRVVIGRGQQQARRFNRVSGDDIEFPGSAAGAAVATGKGNEGHLAIRPGLDAGDSGGRVECRALAHRPLDMDAGIIFGLHRADRNAAGTAATGGAVVVVY